MRELDPKAIRRRLSREEFDRWMVAYYELHLDGSGPAALVASAVHNAAAPDWLRLGIEYETTTAEDYLPPAKVYGHAEESPATEPAVSEADHANDLLEQMARAWGCNDADR